MKQLRVIHQLSLSPGTSILLVCRFLSLSFSDSFTKNEKKKSRLIQSTEGVHNRVGRRLSNPPNHTHTKLFSSLCVWLLVGLIPSEWERNFFPTRQRCDGRSHEGSYEIDGFVQQENFSIASRFNPTRLQPREKIDMSSLHSEQQQSGKEGGLHVSTVNPLAICIQPTCRQHTYTHGAQRYGAWQNYKGTYLLYIPPRRIYNIYPHHLRPIVPLLNDHFSRTMGPGSYTGKQQNGMDGWEKYKKKGGKSLQFDKTGALIVAEGPR